MKLKVITLDSLGGLGISTRTVVHPPKVAYANLHPYAYRLQGTHAKFVYPCMRSSRAAASEADALAVSACVAARLELLTADAAAGSKGFIHLVEGAQVDDLATMRGMWVTSRLCVCQVSAPQFKGTCCADAPWP